MSNFEKELKKWLLLTLKSEDFKIALLAGDASFRKYYRIEFNNDSFVCMVSPPEKENNAQFLKVTELFKQLALNVPKVFASDLNKGYILLSDFGDDLLSKHLQQGQFGSFFNKSAEILLKLQKSRLPRPNVLPEFDSDFILLELSYFTDWFLGGLLDLKIDKTRHNILSSVYSILIQVNKAQPKVIIHRDFHSRNLMVLKDHSLGIIDYQDAMLGPITYDLVSLLKDCYITWPKDKREVFLKAYFDELINVGLLPTMQLAVFKKWFDFTGLQRHLKVLGVFSRLKLRDNKSGYIQDMPRICEYVLEVLASYEELELFQKLFEHDIMPMLQEYWKKTGILTAA